MTTAFVLSGGGSLGAVQVGVLQALASRGIHPERFLSLHDHTIHLDPCHGDHAA